MKKDNLTRILVLSLGIVCLAETVIATTWYVNDADQTLDVYCAAAGNDANDGLSTNSPKLSISAVATSTNFLPGDILFIDTGRYDLGNQPDVFIRSGTEGARITIKGSPKGTLLYRVGEPAVRIRASYTDFSDFSIQLFLNCI